MPVEALVAAGTTAAGIAANLINGSADRRARREARDAIARDARTADAMYGNMANDIETYYKNRGSLGTRQDALDYKTAIAGYNPDSFVYTPAKSFDQTYTKTRDDFINPYYAQIIGDATDAVQHSAAGAGLGRGSGAAAAIAQAVAEKDNELYREAQQMYQDDRNFEYGKYNDYITMMQNNLDRKRAATDTKLTMQGNLAQDYYSTMDSKMEDLLKLNQDRIGTAASYSNAMNGLY